ncbi:RuvB-like domain-containing protein [Candidatus Bipolaricaulota sp. J31]
MAAEIKPISGDRFERIGAHSHIKGLGLDGLKARPVADGMVGQIEAREAAGIIVRMIKEGKMAGRAILLAGPPGTGKTAIAIAIAKELGADVPFVALSGSEIYSAEMKKTEVLMQAMRRAIGVRLHELRKVYEGEVTAFDVKLSRHPYNPYQQIPESARLTLETTDDRRTFNVGSSITVAMINQGVSMGDVIQIDAETGRVIRVGRSEKAADQFEIAAESEKPVPRPTGPVEKEKEFVYTLTLHDLDEMSARRGGGFLTLFFGAPERAEIDPEVRQRVDEMVKDRVEEGTAEIIPGVLFIDEVAMLDIEAFAFLNRAMESELAPVIILASNRGVTKVRGTDIESPHGIPLDLLDRLLIITTRPYTAEEVREILKIRMKEEGVGAEDDALDLLTRIGAEVSLRYAVQMIRPAAEVAREGGRERISVADVERVNGLFADVKKSTKYLREYEERLLA